MKCQKSGPEHKTQRWLLLAAGAALQPWHRLWHRHPHFSPVRLRCAVAVGRPLQSGFWPLGWQDTRSTVCSAQVFILCIKSASSTGAACAGSSSFNSRTPGWWQTGLHACRSESAAGIQPFVWHGRTDALPWAKQDGKMGCWPGRCSSRTNTLAPMTADRPAPPSFPASHRLQARICNAPSLAGCIF